ncbi:hypothetical protein FM120_06865 [Sphingobacterium faecium PCAi_F2.5]|nr:hypothetical protein FM120_06865 [Sphingobacterium faecium PCAi_F2.5]
MPIFIKMEVLLDLELLMNMIRHAQKRLIGRVLMFLKAI